MCLWIVSPGQGWQTGPPIGQGLSSGRHPRLTLASTHCIFKNFTDIEFSLPDRSASTECLPHPWAQIKGPHLFPAFLHTFLWFRRIWKRTLTMACGEVGDVILSSIFPVVTRKTESPFLKRKVVSFSLASFIMAWDKILCCLDNQIHCGSFECFTPMWYKWALRKVW